MTPELFRCLILALPAKHKGLILTVRTNGTFDPFIATPRTVPPLHFLLVIGLSAFVTVVPKRAAICASWTLADHHTLIVTAIEAELAGLSHSLATRKDASRRPRVRHEANRWRWHHVVGTRSRHPVASFLSSLIFSTFLFVRICSSRNLGRSPCEPVLFKHRREPARFLGFPWQCVNRGD